MEEDKSFGSVGYKWMFQILPDRYKVSPLATISRIVDQRRNMNVVVKMVLCDDSMNPSGVWKWAIEKRRDLRDLGRVRTNREIWKLFRSSRIVRSYQTNSKIEQS